MEASEIYGKLSSIIRNGSSIKGQRSGHLGNLGRISMKRMMERKNRFKN